VSSKHHEVAPDVVDRVRSICLALPESYEESAWVGTRWRIRKRTFAHVLMIDAGWPPAYARAANCDGPITVVTFRTPADELEAIRHTGHPFFVARWFDDIVGMILDEDVDWSEVEELLTESYCMLAPKKLVAQVARATG
jgi:hypothetical protein